jgi:putative lipoprotein
MTSSRLPWKGCSPLIRQLDYKKTICWTTLAVPLAAGAITGAAVGLPGGPGAQERAADHGRVLKSTGRKGTASVAEFIPHCGIPRDDIPGLSGRSDPQIAGNYFLRPPAENGNGSECESRTSSGDQIPVHRPPDPWFGRDKARHFVVSFLTTGAAGYSAQHRWKCDRARGVKWGFALSLSLGICKEIRDLRHPGASASFRDLAADLMGSACGAMLVSWW